MQLDFVVQDDGTVIVPAEILEAYGLAGGDTVHAIQTDSGILIAPRDVLINRLLDEIADDLTAKGFTLEKLLSDSTAIRQAIYDEKYAPRDD